MRILFLLILLVSLSYDAITQNIWEEEFRVQGIIIAMHVADSNNIYIASHEIGPNFLYKSSNQGKDWVQIFNIHKAGIESCEDLSIINNTIIYLGFRKGNLLKSTDGGYTFNQILLENIDRIINLSILNDSVGIITNLRLYITRDSWNSTVKLEELSAGNYYSTQFIDDSTLIAGFRYSKGTFMFKLNVFSLNYELFKIDEVGFGINDLIKINLNTLFACGRSNTISGGSCHDAIFKSTDGGKNWRRVLDLYTNDSKFNEHYLPPFGIQSIAFKDSLTGIAVGQFGKIVYTYDGGESWQYENNLPPNIYQPPTMIVRYAGTIPIITEFGGYIHRLKEDNLAPGPEHKYTISGRVWEGDKGQSGIPVSIGFRVTMTDSLGYYKFTRVKAGTYTVKALNKYHENPLSSNYYKPFDYSPLKYDIDLTSDTSGFDFNAIDLRIFYTASGYVLNTDSKGIANITFKIADSTVVSDSSGKFHFPRIESKRQYDLTPITEGYSYSPAYHTINLITGDTTDLKFTATPTTSVWESGLDRGIIVSPNPARDYIVIALDRWTPLSKWRPSVQVQIFDMLGIEVGQSFLIVNDSNNNSQSGMIDLLKIDVSHLPAGVYFIRIGNKVEKFVKM